MKVPFKAASVAALFVAGILHAQSPEKFFVFVSNERSGDVSVIDGMTDEVVGTFPVGKRPRGIHASPDGSRVFVTLTGSPRMAPGVDQERVPADKASDALAVIDPVARRLVDKWHVGSDPEQFAISRDGKLAFIANEDEASISIIDLASGQSRGKITVSAEPEGVGVNPINREVYVTCEEKGEVFVIVPDQQRVLEKIDVGGRPRSVAFTSDGKRAFIPSEGGSCGTEIDAVGHRVVKKISLGEGTLPMGTAISRDQKELYVSTGRANSIAVVDLTKDELVATIPVGKRVWSIALTPDGKKLYTANGTSNDVSVVDPAARKELKRVKVGDGPWGIAIVPEK